MKVDCLINTNKKKQEYFVKKFYEEKQEIIIPWNWRQFQPEMKVKYHTWQKINHNSVKI